MSSANLFFTVYATERAIEIRSGYYEHPDVRVISSCCSYEVAQNLALLVAEMNHLPMVDRIQMAEGFGQAEGEQRESDAEWKHP